jgi:hypothetical protein
MPTVTMIRLYKDLANRPVTSRHMEYVLERIEKLLRKRAKAAWDKLVKH